MTAREANEIIETGVLTVGHLRTCLDAAAPYATNQTSVVNGQISKHRAHVMFMVALDGRDDTEPAIRRDTPNRDHALARNILREFGDAVPW